MSDFSGENNSRSKPSRKFPIFAWSITAVAAVSATVMTLVASNLNASLSEAKRTDNASQAKVKLRDDEIVELKAELKKLFDAKIAAEAKLTAKPSSEAPLQAPQCSAAEEKARSAEDRARSSEALLKIKTDNAKAWEDSYTALVESSTTDKKNSEETIRQCQQRETAAPQAAQEKAARLRAAGKKLARPQPATNPVTNPAANPATPTPQPGNPPGAKGKPINLGASKQGVARQQGAVPQNMRPKNQPSPQPTTPPRAGAGQRPRLPAQSLP